ncbi:carbohydrate-binding family 9-like protein [Bacillus sp. FJAT-49711]|uniref:carbohydrate-binding family 9-like protein n=1 Tax=Bacillus sp. FJAT-49711 TaxID=2833585 RepID=UPI001BCA10FC|nr:carbohydrate-binding family 9-like protein [Bacillus sp. FJAT-49711]MBS4219090.1 carbohydrate-binding family 9-like protein [Bacillus sp. FJAT-49711]
MSYIAYRTKEKIVIDGKLNEKSWQLAPRSPRFVDIINGSPALYGTQSAVLWDDEYLYIGFWVEEPLVQAEITERDGLIFNENNVEVFIDGGDTYYEFQINALNTIYEVFFIWRDVFERGGKYDIPEFDIFGKSAYTFGGNHDRVPIHFWEGTHPRGLRWAFRNWDFPGLRAEVHVDGKINDENSIDKGWTAELAFPWSGMKWLANGRSLPPSEGDLWKLQFARYEKLISLNKNIGYAWKPIGSDDNHRPEKFTAIQFSNKIVGE